MRPQKNPLLDLPWRDVLALLVEYLNVQTTGTKRLWWVLTALRGPDNESSAAKDATTAVIRHAIGLRQGVGNGAVVREDSEAAVALRDEIRLNRTATGYHFIMHASEAFEALNLNWWRNNNPR